jgi:hypothetical protein
MYQTDDEYHYCILEWEASLPREKKIKPRGNAMTQKYYTERLLPIYIDAIQTLRVYGSQMDSINAGEPGEWLFQEDGDPSHGKRKPGLAQELKDINWVATLYHPAESPDLNPQEATWNILKQRVRRRVWSSLEELKAILQEEWGKITMEEVRRRISEMPGRCKLLVETGGKPVKSVLW